MPKPPLPLPLSGQSQHSPLRLVLDTNVVMALWHFCDPRLLILREFIDTRAVVLLTREECLEELRRVLTYEQFKLDGPSQVLILEDYIRTAQRLPDASDATVEATKALPQCKDRDDQKFLELAWESEAHALVTRDKLLLGLARRPMIREKLLILTPEKLLQIPFFIRDEVL